MTSIALGYATLLAFYGGIGLLVQSKIARIDPTNKALALAAVAAASALCVTVVNPLGGALSDRTSSSLGRRAPWMLSGAVAALASALFLLAATSVIQIAIIASFTFAAAHLFQAALAAIVPDQVPKAQRGRVSALIGVTSALGWALGTQIISRLNGEFVNIVVLGGGLTIVAALFATFAVADTPPTERIPASVELTDRVSLPALLEAFRDRDFAYVFLGRALMMFSYYLVLVYLLYILQDYIHRPLHTTAVQGVATIVTLSGGCAILTTIVGGVLADRWKRYKPFVLAAGMVGALALIIPLVSRSWGAFLAFAALQGAAVGAYYSVDTAIATLVLPNSSTAARDLGVLNVAASAPPIVAPFVAALIVETGGYGALFPVAGVGALVAATSILGVKQIR